MAVRAVPALLETMIELGEKVVAPVPPRVTARVPVVSEIATPSDEVAIQLGLPVV